MKNLDKLKSQYFGNPQSLLRINEKEAKEIEKKIREFYKLQLRKSGLCGYVVGMSGGLDSSVVAKLLVKSVGRKRVHGVTLPFNSVRVNDVIEYSKKLKIDMNDVSLARRYMDRVVDLLEMMGEKSYDEEKQKIKRGNIIARVRMIVIRDVAKAKNCLVAGTTNASERDLGYFTLAGDGVGGVDNEAIYNLYKTTVKELAEYLKLPAHIIKREPSADLWEGQTDEKELGLDYEIIDQILVGYRLKLNPNDIKKVLNEVPTTKIKDIIDRVEKNKFKTKQTPCVEFN